MERELVNKVRFNNPNGTEEFSETKYDQKSQRLGQTKTIRNNMTATRKIKWEEKQKGKKDEKRKKRYMVK